MAPPPAANRKESYKTPTRSHERILVPGNTTAAPPVSPTTRRFRRERRLRETHPLPAPPAAPEIDNAGYGLYTPELLIGLSGAESVAQRCERTRGDTRLNTDKQYYIRYSCKVLYFTQSADSQLTVS